MREISLADSDKPDGKKKGEFGGEAGKSPSYHPASPLPACEVVGLPGGCSNSFFSTVFFYTE